MTHYLLRFPFEFAEILRPDPLTDYGGQDPSARKKAFFFFFTLASFQ